MSAWSRLRAWLKSSTSPGVPADWQQQLAAVAASGRFESVARLVEGWRLERPGSDGQFREWLDKPGDLAGCSCSARRVVVIHDRGTYCGDAQHTQLWHAVDGSGADDAEGAVAAVLDVLRGDRHA